MSGSRGYGAAKHGFPVNVGSLCRSDIRLGGIDGLARSSAPRQASRGTLSWTKETSASRTRKAEIREVLNNGTPGVPRLRTEISSKKEFDPRRTTFSGPKLIATRVLPGRALESRCLTEDHARRRATKRDPAQSRRALPQEARGIRNQLLALSLRHFKGPRGGKPARAHAISSRGSNKYSGLSFR